MYLDENCFGPDGYWSEKPGWQQIADAVAGSAYMCRQRTAVVPLTPDLRLEDLFLLIMQAWHKKPRLTADEGFWIVCKENPYGKDLKILSPVVRYAAKTSLPRWKSRPVPFFHSKELKYGVSWEETRFFFSF